MDQKELQEKLVLLTEEHRALDEAIDALIADTSAFDQLKLQRLKKRKLSLKDQIARLHILGVPDIIA